MAVLLAASLAEHAPRGSAMFAAVPEPVDVWGEPSAVTRAAFAHLGVRVVSVSAPFGRDRSHGNKIAALRVPARADRLVFLDSDILALAPFRDRRAFDADVAAKPADFQTWTDDIDVWRRTFESGGAALPSERVLTTVSGESTPPYFNSGVLVVREPARLADEWERCGKALMDVGLPFREMWSDQPALAVALQTCAVRVATVGEDLNFPAHQRSMPSDGSVVLCHYHWPKIIHADLTLRNVVCRLVVRHPPVGEVLKGDPQWRAILEAPGW